MDDRVDVFVSHAGPDAAWAAWVDQVLRRVGFSTITDLYDFEAGQNFILLMDDALRRAERVVLLWSPGAKDRPMVEAEWTSAMASHPGRVLPVIVEPCDVPAILVSTIHVDLSACTDGEVAARRLVEALQRPVRPETPVGFPGRVPGDVPVGELPVAFPPAWAAARVGTRVFTTDKLLLSRGSNTELLVIEPSGSIKLGKNKVHAASVRQGRDVTSRFVASVGGQDAAICVTFHQQRITGYIRATELVIDGSTVPIVDRR